LQVPKQVSKTGLLGQFLKGAIYIETMRLHFRRRALIFYVGKKPGAISTIVSYNASAVKFYNAMNSLAPFPKKEMCLLTYIYIF
jgi:hypothetical protein